MITVAKVILLGTFHIKYIEFGLKHVGRLNSVSSCVLLYWTISKHSLVEQGCPSGSSGQAHTKLLVFAKQRWVQPPLFTPQRLVPKLEKMKIHKCYQTIRIVTYSLGLVHLVHWDCFFILFIVIMTILEIIGRRFLMHWLRARMMDHLHNCTVLCK